MRIFRNCLDMVQEIDRELAVSGQTVEVKHYQNKVLEGDDRITKELIGVNFTISKPLNMRDAMLEFLYKEEAEKITAYCIEELRDRVSGEPRNPGNSYLIRKDLWQQFLTRGKYEGAPEMFHYTYANRINQRDFNGDWYDQVKNVCTTLEEDGNSRRAMILIMHPDDTQNSAGATTRIPCSVSYQFFIRNGALHCLYYIRSNDYFKHFGIDIWLAAGLMQHIASQVLGVYPELKIGALHYMCGSLHAYHEDLSKWVIY